MPLSSASGIVSWGFTCAVPTLGLSLGCPPTRGGGPAFNLKVSSVVVYMRGLFQCFMHFKFLFFLPFALFLFGGSTDALPASFILAAGDRGVGGPGSRLGQETESGVRFPADCQLLAGTLAAGCRGHIQGSEGCSALSRNLGVVSPAGRRCVPRTW